jgi:hypothetical protein
VLTVKFSLISATSIFALLSAAVGPAHAGILNTTPNQLNIYDLVHDGETSSDGGDITVTKQDPSDTAATALEASINGLQTVSFTGRIDLSARAYPMTPLGAAPGSKPNEAFASSIDDNRQWTPTQRARALGQVRVASLIGTIGNGPVANERTGRTVFVSEGSQVAFNDSGDDARPGGTRAALAFAPSSTSTATITVAGAGNSTRQGPNGGTYTVTANSLRAIPLAGGDASKGLALADMVQPTLGYHYAPQSTTMAKGSAVPASFSDAITATGNLAQVIAPAPVATIQTSQVQPKAVRPDQVLTSEIQKQQFQAVDAGIGGQKLTDVVPPILNPRADTLIDASRTDGTRTLISTTVSANPSATAATYLTSVIRRAPTEVANPSIDAFEIGPTAGPKTRASAATTVPEPLRGKIVASAGPLNGSLALP